jgi:hypothetical protein
MLRGFELVKAESRKLRLIVRIGGLEKSGKTHFALSAPGPIGLIDMDRGLEGVVEKFAATKPIHTCNLRNMASRTQKDHELRWNMFKTNHYALLDDKDIQTIVWDTDTEAWEMGRLAFFGKLSQIKPHHYAEINREFRGLVDAAFDRDKNLILICKYKKQYVVKENSKSDDGQWNGEYEAAGFSDLPYMVQVNLRSRAVRDATTKETTPTIEVINCRQNMGLTGTVFEGDMATFPWIAANIIEDTTPYDWE